MVPGFDLIVTVLLALPLPLKYKIFPMEGTPYLLFALYFLLMLGMVLLSLFSHRLKKIGDRVKTIVFLSLLAVTLFTVMYTAIVDRKTTSDFYSVHDIILQQEAAMRYVLEGKNPYKETYFGTPLEKWHYAEDGKEVINPALYHFVMPPWYLLFPFSIYIFSIPLFGFFDGRLALVFCIVGIIVLLLKWFKSQEFARLTIAMVLLLPSGVDYLIEGRSDIFALFWFLLSIFLLEKKKFFLSAVIYGLSLMSKQTIWFSAPFYLVALWYEHKHSLRRFYWYIFVLCLTCLVLVTPFFLWDAGAFINSVILYVSGGTANGYPISGYGFGMVLRQFGFIQESHAYFPFVLLQLAIGVPVIAGGVWYYLRKPSVWRLFFGYAMTLAVVWYFSRYFNNSHVVFLAQLFILSFMKKNDEQSKA
ncbi:MAG: hypothetical protein AAB508_06940 [Patescibacteria group bacterium]